MTALLAAVHSGVLVSAALWSVPAVAATVLAGQLLLAFGVAGAGPADPRGTWLVVVGAGLLASLVVALGDATDLGVLAPAAAGAVVAALLRELLRRDGRRRVTESVTLTTTAAALGVLAAAWLVTARLADGDDVVVLGAAGVGVAALVWAVPGPRGVLGPVAVVAAGATGVVADPLGYGPGPVAAAMVAAVGGLAGVVALATTDRWAPRTSAHGAVTASVPLALAGPLVHVAGRFATALG